ncbi:MAG: F0F1 ATP synthase subunit delta [Candidatus Moranbacteria bacterium]|jgi:F0F1-type ATP synthase delta subunit|nr:F0F1 ATP synthase subunit delta [Candidatus Moranbacteria bacterium]
MRPTVSQYAEALEELSSEHMATPKALVTNLLGYLRRRGELAKGLAILKRLEQLSAKQAKRVGVTVVTARKAEPGMKALLERKAQSLFPGQSVELSYEIDSDLIGGARFRSEEQLYDVTIAAEVAALRSALSK